MADNLSIFNRFVRQTRVVEETGHPVSYRVGPYFMHEAQDLKKLGFTVKYCPVRGELQVKSGARFFGVQITED